MLFAVLVFAGCQKSRVYERNSPIGASWEWEELHRFELDVEDTLANYDLFLNVRHETDYGFSNLWVNILTIFPNGDSTSARVEIPLAESDGRWIGQCSGPVCFRRDLIAVFRKFPEKGTYIFEIQQDTREANLQGIRDIGIRIEEVNTSAGSR